MLRRPPSSTLFPSRRSSDLEALLAFGQDLPGAKSDILRHASHWIASRLEAEKQQRSEMGFDDLLRSEEHTSELQSRPHLVCRLLLEKKKKKETKPKQHRKHT